MKYEYIYIGLWELCSNFYILGNFDQNPMNMNIALWKGVAIFKVNTGEKGAIIEIREKKVKASF